MTANRAPGTAWSLRADLEQYVRTEADEALSIVMWDDLHKERRLLTIRRRDARLLAKRINQCLDETRKP